MCGIIMKVNHNKEASREVLNQFQDQRHRGTNGFGALSIDKDGIINVDRATSEIVAMIDLRMNTSNAILFHHRIPTSSTNRIAQTHPMHIESGSFNYDYYFMHNGMVRNCETLFDTHVKDEGITYSTFEKLGDKTQFNDSESLGIEIAKFIEGQSTEIKAYGSAAFFIVQAEKVSHKVVKIFFGHNDSNPLNMYKKDGEIMVSSEGKGDPIETDILYSFDPSTKKMKLSKRKMVIQAFTPVVTTSYTPTSRDDDWESYAPIKDSAERTPRGELDDDMSTASSSLLDNDMPPLIDHEEEACDIIAGYFQELRNELHEDPFGVDLKGVLVDLRNVLASAKQEAEDIFVFGETKEVNKVNDKLYAK